MAAIRSDEIAPALRGGVIAGLAGGLVLAVFLTAMNLAQGADLWLGAKLAGAPFLGERAMQPGFDGLAILVGVASHLAVSVGWGALFGLLAYGLTGGVTLAGGVLWGIVVWLAMYRVVLPMLGLARIAAAMPVGTAVFEHVLFGMATAFAFLPFQPRPPQRLAPRIEMHEVERRSTGTL